MEPRAHHVVIGLFTLLVAAAAVMFGLWLSKSKQHDEQNYLVVFSEPVRGLSRGSPVQYNGIRVGDVSDLSLDPQDVRRVLARIRVDGRIPVREDTRARLELTGITGLAVIELSGGSPESPMLRGQGDQPAVIHATPSSLSKLLSEGGDIMTHISDLLVQVGAFLSPDNAQRFSDLLGHIEQIAGTLAEGRESWSVLADRFDEVGKQAAEALANASSLMARVDGLVAKDGSRTLDSAQRAMGALERSATDLARILRENQGALADGMQGLGEVGPALQALRETLNTIRGTTRRLDDDPMGYLLGREQIQEFRP